MQKPVIEEIFSKIGVLSEKRSQDNRETCKLFNPLSILPINENAMSSIFAFVLDPSADHGQGKHFLTHFLMYFSLNELSADAEPIRVEVEKSTNDGRRIDVLVTLGNSLMIIENKFRGAVDQVSQCQDYYDWARTRTQKDKIHLFYMSPEGGDPSNDSIPEVQRNELRNAGRLHVASFNRRKGRKSITEFLEICQEGTPEKMRIFLVDLIKLIEGEENKVDEYDEELFAWLSESPERAEQAWEIRRTDKLLEFRRYLIKATLNELRGVINKDGWSISEVDDTVFDRWGGISIRKDDWRNVYAIDLANDWGDFNGIYYAFSHTHKTVIDEERALSSKIQELFKGRIDFADEGAPIWWNWSQIKNTWDDQTNLARMCEKTRHKVVDVWRQEITELMRIVETEPIRQQIEKLAAKLNG